MIKGTHRFNNLLALTLILCLTALFSVFSLSKAVSAAPQSAEAELQRFGIQGNVTCSTYGNNPNGFMAKAGDTIYIVDIKNNRVASIENPDAVNSGNENLSIGFQTDDPDAICQVLTEGGFSPSPFVSPAPTVRFFFVTDPAGVKVQFIS